MNWKKSLLVVGLVGTTALTMVACGQTQETTPPATPPATGAMPAPGAKSPRPTPPAGGPSGNVTALAMDLASAAAKLGVTEQQLRDALEDAGQKPPDFAAAAEQLGVSEQALLEAIGFPGGGNPPAGGTPPAGLTPPAPGTFPGTQGQTSQSQ